MLESISSIRITESNRSPQKTPPVARSPKEWEFGADMMDVDIPKEEKLPKQPFEIHTPLRTYFLRAKHAEAMKDWVRLIHSARNPEDISPIVETSIEGSPVPGKKSLLYSVGGKQKTVKLSKDSVIIGRAAKSDIRLEDVKVSRNHCRIEINSSMIPVLTDLGSMCGTIVNGKKIIKAALKPGDKILIGSTEIVFQAETNSK